MCDCNIEIMRIGTQDHVPHSARRHHINTAADIQRGEGTRTGAGNLLCGIMHNEVSIDDLPVPLSTIEAVAGRKIGDPIL